MKTENVLKEARYQLSYDNLVHTSFEDGMSNDIIDKIKELIEQNKSSVYEAILEAWAACRHDSYSLSKVLRLIAAVVDKQDQGCFLNVLRAGLERNKDTYEAAIMVIEEWRTIECFKLLQQFLRRIAKDENMSCFIIRYAQTVYFELADELHMSFYVPPIRGQ